jgi:hypothetical protein
MPSFYLVILGIARNVVTNSFSWYVLIKMNVMFLARVHKIYCRHALPINLLELIFLNVLSADV